MMIVHGMNVESRPHCEFVVVPLLFAACPDSLPV